MNRKLCTEIDTTANKKQYLYLVLCFLRRSVGSRRGTPSASYISMRRDQSSRAQSFQGQQPFTIQILVINNE